jgi:hypothetical protein
LLSQDDVAPALWTAICRENGWEDSIVRKGNAHKAWQRNENSHLGSRRAGAAHCAYPGCHRWVAAGAELCAAGHPQSEDVELGASALESAAIPF